MSFLFMQPPLIACDGVPSLSWSAYTCNLLANVAKQPSFDSWGKRDQSQDSIGSTVQEQDQSYEINKGTGSDQPVETKETRRALYCDICLLLLIGD